MIFLYKLLSADFVFSSLSVNGTPLGTYLKVTDNGILPEIKWPVWLSEDFKQLILKMIRYEPRERCKISEVHQVLIIIIIIIGSYLAHVHTVQCALSSYISPYASLKSSVLMDDLNSDKVFE